MMRDILYESGGLSKQRMISALSIFRYFYFSLTHYFYMKATEFGKVEKENLRKMILVDR